MASAPVSVPIKDGANTNRSFRAISSDGAATGDHTSLHGLVDTAQQVINPATAEGQAATESAIAAVEAAVEGVSQALAEPLPLPSGAASAANQAAIVAAIGVLSAKMAERLDSDASGSPIYAGSAPVGSATSAAVWTIAKYTYDASGNYTGTLWANVVDGVVSSAEIWDDRASLTYS